MTDVVFSFFKVIKEHPNCSDCRHEKKIVLGEVIERDIPGNLTIDWLEARSNSHATDLKIPVGQHVKISIHLGYV